MKICTTYMIKRVFVFMLLLVAWSSVSAQDYQTTYNNTNVTNVSIQHKQPKWIGMRGNNNYGDTFDSNGWTTTENGTPIQATNTSVDTLYVHKGTDIAIAIPYMIYGAVSSASFVRWFDYRTDGNYYCGTGLTYEDLLTADTSVGSGYGYGYASDYNGDKVALDDGVHNVYRFANGYVGGFNLTTSRAIHSMTFHYPSDTEFASITNSNGSFNNGDNDYYIVAADVSMYKDCAETYVEGGSDFGATNNWCEPTLSGRTLFYIIGVEDETPPTGYEHHWALTESEYHGGTNNGNEYYLEEYEITFPARRIASVRTPELVALSKGANAYAIPGTNSSNDGTTLNVSFATGENNGFTLVNSTVTGTNRVIQFGTSSGGRNPTYYGQWTVTDGSTATILVTKTVSGTTYNIARYKLTFKEETTLLTQTQVAGLDNLTGNETYWWKDMTYRSPAYIDSHYELIASQTFSYDESSTSEVVENGKSQYYPFPIEWDYCGYAFYDGSSDDDVNSIDYGWWPTSDDSEAARQAMYTQWGMYAIVNDYIGYADTYKTTPYRPPVDTAKDEGGYWLYVDASDIPRTIVEIPFEEKLCAGSELFATAWVKDASSDESANCSGLLFTIMGVYIDDNGNETHEPIYRQCSSQIDMTNYLTSQTNETGLGSAITGKGAGTNEWFQLYFSFLNTDDIDYDYYTLKVESYCATTSGGDFYFDEVKIYVLRPDLEMAQFDQICSTSGDAQSLMRLDLNYEAMMSRLGYDPSDYTNDSETTASVDFVIINIAKYYNALASIENPTQEEKEVAFKDAIVTFYNVNGDEHQFPTLDFYLNYDKNTEYNEENAGSNIVSFDSNDEGYFYRRLNGSIQELSIDCLTDMVAYTEYLILLEPHSDIDNRTDEERLDEFISLIDDGCAIKTYFSLTSTTILKLNGETIDPTADYCAGQEFVIAPEVTYTNSEGETIYLDGIYFDWFFGSREEYEAANNEFSGVSLEEALLAFRTYYPNAEELSKTETPPTGEGDAAFTQDHYDIIEYYLGQAREGGLNNMLVLHESHLSIRVLTTGLELVIQPIETYLEDEEGNPLQICFGYVPMTLMASGDAPVLKMGFSNINYPDDDYEPCLRLGLAQMEECGEDTPFTINLCNATYVTEEGVDIDHLGVAEGMDMLLLVDTDDPTYHEMLLGKEDEIEIVVGKVTRLYAKDDNSDDPRADTPTSAQDIGSYMQIYFYGEIDDENDSGVTPFTVKEGYYYVLSVYFQEKGSFDDGEQAVGAACWGTFPLEIKVVPEYLVWQGDEDDNWNNDNHWRRADKEELNKPATDTYPTNAENGTGNGFVPMLFSKVVIPKNSVAELYMAGFKEGTDEMLSWEGDEDTANHDDVSEHPTSNIMYDLMLYENPSSGALKTEHYRVNLCDEIHLEPGAQLLHSEQLIYNKAWTEVLLPQGPWTLQATPLRGVISGDWYTKKAGSETAEYFTDITFNSSDNNRYTPLVYQRSWGTDDSVILENYTGMTGETSTTSVPSYASTGWSSVYNDTSVPYQVGEGFSLAANLNSSSDSLMFRFPKADEEYTTSSATTFERTGAGTLLISELVDRSDPDKDNESNIYKEDAKITVELTQTGNGYYIIGNPFTAPMSMEHFMAENEDIKGYWLESTYGPIAGTTAANGQPVSSWGTSDVLVDPYCAFFVTTDENDISPLADSPVTVTFTKDMQEETLSTPTSPTHMHALSLRATNGAGTTSAALLYDDSATDDYLLGEDAILLEDVSWQHEGTPLVYTIAGDMAVGVNRVNSMPQVPLGVFADEDASYTITFVGVDCINEPSLFDSYMNTDTPLTEGYVLELEGPSHGRYFIRAKGAATKISLTENEVFDITAYSPTPGTVIVSSTAELEDIGVYSVGGMLLRRINVGGNYSCTIEGINSGIAIVRAKTSEGTFVKKLRVR